MKIKIPKTYGKDMDDLMAIHVMGWKHHKEGFWGVKNDDQREEFKNHPETEEQRQLHYWCRKMHLSTVGWWWIDVDGDFCIREEDWMPSTDIKQAYRALRIAIRRTHQQDMHLEHLEGCGWSASTCYDDDAETDKWKDFMHADTLPQAMCLAALKACLPKDAEIEFPEGVIIKDDDEN